MKPPTKKEIEEYRKEVRRGAKEFDLTAEDLSNLYDIFYMVNWQDMETMKLNKMDKWFKKFFERVEKIVIPELYEKYQKIGGK